jgi:hypothetical protein
VQALTPASQYEFLQAAEHISMIVAISYFRWEKRNVLPDHWSQVFTSRFWSSLPLTLQRHLV